MEIIETIIETLNSPAAPLWLKLLILVTIVVALILWLIKPPHWRDAETPNRLGSERHARPPD
jgi:hypothetical protein